MNNLYYSDTRTALKKLDSESFDLVVTAPPAYEYRNTRESWKKHYDYQWTSLDTYLDDMKQVFTDVFRVMKNHHYCIITVGDVKAKLGVGHWETRTLPLPAYREHGDIIFEIFLQPFDVGLVLLDRIIEFVFLSRKSSCPITLIFTAEYPARIVFALNNEYSFLRYKQKVYLRRGTVFFRNVDVAKHFAVTSE